MAYFDDTTYVNYPYAVSASGTDIWIADTYGLRGLKHTSDGAFVKQIGQSGFRYGATTSISLDWVTDVVVDGSGNI